jgi:PAS domain S-box-containing protein
MTIIRDRRYRLAFASLLLLVGGTFVLLQGYHFSHLRDAQQVRESNLETQVAVANVELDTERKRFGLILEGAPVAVIVCDGRGRITACNEAATKLFGYAARELVGQHSAVLVADDMRPRHVEYMTAAPQKFNSDHPMLATEFHGEAKHKDGSTFLVKITCRGIVIDGAPEFAAFIKPDKPAKGS